MRVRLDRVDLLLSIESSCQPDISQKHKLGVVAIAWHSNCSTLADVDQTRDAKSGPRAISEKKPPITKPKQYKYHLHNRLFVVAFQLFGVLALLFEVSWFSELCHSDACAPPKQAVAPY